MGWEVYPPSIYEILKKFDKYTGIKKIYVTENGVAFPDEVKNSKVDDPRRIKFLQDYLQQVLKAKQEGHKVSGYFVWTLTDNFEWAEGFHPRFGLIHVDLRHKSASLNHQGNGLLILLNKGNYHPLFKAM